MIGVEDGFLVEEQVRRNFCSSSPPLFDVISLLPLAGLLAVLDCLIYNLDELGRDVGKRRETA